MDHCVVSTEDLSLVGGSLPARGETMTRSATNEDGGYVDRAASGSEDAVVAEDSQLDDAPKAFPDSDDEGDEGTRAMTKKKPSWNMQLELVFDCWRRTRSCRRSFVTCRSNAHESRARRRSC